jgi:O-antigen ligase
MTGTAPLQPARQIRTGSALVPTSLNFNRFVLVTCIGALSGLVLPSFGPLRQPVLALVFMGLCAKLFSAILRRQFTFAWGLSAFLCATEPAFRVYARVLPYLALDYVLLGAGALTFALLRPKKSAQWLPVIAYAIYVALEITGSLSADRWDEARGILVPSLLMLVLVLNSGRVRFSPSATTFIFASFIVGAVTLTGFALRSYLAGNITWGTQSNLEASGGMPPNHISVLMSVAVFACVVLSEDAKRIQRILILGVATVLGALMVLTFSRGGTVILLGSLLLYYVVLRGASRRTIFILVAVAAMGWVVSYGTREITGGKIADRYHQSGTSNRYAIVIQGWGIYTEHPILGVGTSNFREAIYDTQFARVTGAHNELIRAAAEHGTLGLITWLLFIGSAFVVAWRHGEAHQARRGLRIVILVFATTSMFYNGLKLTVQPFLILVALSAFTALESAPKPTPPRKRTMFT